MKTPAESFDRLYEIMRKLRSPEGCPGQGADPQIQSGANLVEESYECVEAVSSGDLPHVKEEIGDVFLVSTFMAYMYEQEGSFSVSDVLEEVSDKLVRRHPHVFGDSSADTPDKS
jgi:tetrapyrrole methylase family protein/MazG family protein